jgi:RepB plasmid partitioning protein/ParB/Sulfiredoxin domain
MAFEGRAMRIPITDIEPLRLVSSSAKRTAKYAKIVASIREVGIIEPPVVARNRAAPGKYLLLDGHLRLEVLKDAGDDHVVCLVSTDDEAFTYNKRVSRLAIVQEHKMILRAIERGVPEERIAKALNIDVHTLRQKKRLLDGICPEAAELLKDKHVATGTFWVLKRMAPMRQIEAAEMMVALNKYTINYARSLLAATPQAQLVDTQKPKVLKELTDTQIALMERESANLDREFKMVEQSYGTDHLDLVLAKGYLAKLLGNPRVVRYLVQHHQEILTEFQKLAVLESSAA